MVWLILGSSDYVVTSKSVPTSRLITGLCSSIIASKQNPMRRITWLGWTCSNSCDAFFFFFGKQRIINFTSITKMSTTLMRTCCWRYHGRYYEHYKKIKSNDRLDTRAPRLFETLRVALKLQSSLEGNMTRSERISHSGLQMVKTDVLVWWWLCVLIHVPSQIEETCLHASCLSHDLCDLPWAPSTGTWQRGPINNLNGSTLLTLQL